MKLFASQNLDHLFSSVDRPPSASLASCAHSRSYTPSKPALGSIAHRLGGIIEHRTPRSAPTSTAFHTKMLSSARSTSRAAALMIAATLLLLATTTEAQVSSAFAGTSFPLSSFIPANTFTPVTTFAQATGGNPTTIGGPGPSPATSSYQYSYTVPTQTVPAIFPSQVYQSLASSAGYNTAAAAKNLVPDPNNLQIPSNGAADQFNFAAAKAVFFSVAAAAVVVVML
ncbi:hypothetical protein PHBOTO_001589 [Pseudozyma hubeiensis]|nr:hypothetical protein PHBOTO_001589 [Pseudozyma hubeiensis]